MKGVIDAVLYCDASSRKGRNGIGICLLNGNGLLVHKVSRRIRGYGRDNTALEGHAVCVGLELAAKLGYGNVRVYTDSSSVIRAARKGCARTGAMRKFIETFTALREKITISLRWVRGHAGQVWNTMADKLARNAQWSFSQRFQNSMVRKLNCLRGSPIVSSLSRRVNYKLLSHGCS